MFVLNRRVVLHAIFMISARWRGDAGSSPLDGASTAAPSPHWLISTQATIKACDRIYVMESGVVVEEGTHAELVERGGVYAGMVERQSFGD